MRRTDRLFEIIQSFRGGKLVRGKALAEKLGVSLRTIYRDIDTLTASGLPIKGERGVGYMLDGPIFLPPLALDKGELEALHLGMELVSQLPDKTLNENAARLLEKVNAGLPRHLAGRAHLQNMSVFLESASPAPERLAQLRQAIAAQHTLDISYITLSGTESQRVIRPLQLEYWGKVWTCTAWCEMRESFRSFRLDRIQSCQKAGVFAPEDGKRYSDYLKIVEGV
ncbi:MAG TPA: YafY family transcriptional regulator [Rhodobacteraceae bacterium]|nr:YafY family transcriptional regulator [Paracoccaceae bacterium]